MVHPTAAGAAPFSSWILLEFLNPKRPAAASSGPCRIGETIRLAKLVGLNQTCAVTQLRKHPLFVLKNCV